MEFQAVDETVRAGPTPDRFSPSWRTLAGVTTAGRKSTHGGTVMTDEPNESHDDQRTATNEYTSHEPVSQETAWELVTQSPYDEDAGELTTTIVDAVAEAEGVSPQDVKSPPLYDVVDTAALEAAYVGPGGDTHTNDPSLFTEFLYRGFRVVVRSDGWVLVYRRDE